MYGIIRIQKHNSMASVRGSGKHKDREQETFNADPLRTPLNVTEGAQSSDALLSAIQARVELATVQVMGNYKPVIAVEYLITASPEFFRTQPPEVVDAYFDKAKVWLRQKHGVDNVVSITRHNDETSPHLSAFVVPLVIRAAGTRKRSVIAGKDEKTGGLPGNLGNICQAGGDLSVSQALFWRQQKNTESVADGVSY